VQCGFVDEIEQGRYAIPDLYDHAPDYVQKRLRRELERQEKGQERKRAFAARSRVLSAGWRTKADIGGLNPIKADDGGLRPTVADIGSPPAPAPREASPNGEVSAEPTPKPTLTAQDFRQAWNAATHFTLCRKMTEAREKHLRARLADTSWAASWQEALARAAASPFCRGENDRGWRADVDWFLRPNTVTKILEGKYDRTGNGHTKPRETDDQIAERMRHEREQWAREAREAEEAGGLAALAARAKGKAQGGAQPIRNRSSTRPRSKPSSAA
jgi:hypothetical protein